MYGRLDTPVKRNTQMVVDTKVVRDDGLIERHFPPGGYSKEYSISVALLFPSAWSDGLSNTYCLMVHWFLPIEYSAIFIVRFILLCVVSACLVVYVFVSSGVRTGMHCTPSPLVKIVWVFKSYLTSRQNCPGGFQRR